MAKNRNGKRKSKRFIAITEIISAILLVASFSSIIVCGLLKDHGYGDFWWPAVGIISFFFCDFLALFLLFRVRGDAISYDVDKKNRKYDAFDLSRLENMTVENINDKFKAHKFKEIKGKYLRKKMLSFFKDSICYYAKNVIADNFRSTIEDELKRMDKLGERSKNICFLLFVQKDDISESDFKELREISKSFILSETIVPVSSCSTIIIVLIDNKTHEGKFLDINSKHGMSVYAHGCRLIKKYFSVESF